jgi:protocatechuate 3,4-dioxygenase beta subunit
MARQTKCSKVTWFAIVSTVFLLAITIMLALGSDGQVHRSSRHNASDLAPVDHPNDDSTPTDMSAERSTADPTEVSNRGVDATRTESFDLHRVLVRCRSETGHPIAGAMIRFVSSASADAAKLDEVDPLDFVEHACKARATTISDGTASVEVGSGRWFVVARAIHCHADGRWIDVQTTTSVEFTLSAAVTIDGLVIDGVTKAPVLGATALAFVMATTDETGNPSLGFARRAVGQRVVTDGEGKFRLDDVPAARLEVDVTADGYPTARVYTTPGGPRVVVELNGRGAADGVVVDENGAPIVGAEVETWLRGKLPGQLVGRTTTDDQGEFHFHGIVDGDVGVDAKKRGYAFAKQNLTLEAGKPTWIEFELGPEAPLKGLVLDELRRPVEGATVHVSDRELAHEIGQMVTEKDGSWYMLWCVPGHRIDVTIDHPAFFFEEFKDVALRDDVQTFTLRRLLGLHGRVVDPDGKPVTRFALWTDARLRDHEQEQTRALSAPWTEVVDDRGEFHFDTLVPCDYVLRFTAEGLLDEVVQYPLSSSRAAQPKPLEVRMRRGDVVSGRVLDEASRPLTGVTVGVAGATDGGRDVAPLAASCASTAGDGGFTLRNAPRVPFDLVFSSPDRGSTVVSDLRLDDFPRDFVLPRPGSICGQLRSPWRDPSSCLEVRVQRRGSWVGRTLPVDARGQFDSGPLAPGEYELDVADQWARSELDGDFDFSRMVTVRTGVATSVDVDVAPRVSLRGAVHDRKGDLDPYSVTIRLARADRPDEVVAIARLQSDRRYMVPGLATGRYVVTLDLGRPGRLGHVEREVDVDATRATELDFEVDSVRFTGRVVDGSRLPVVADVTLLDARNGAKVGAVRCDRAGQFEVVPPAPTRCVAWIVADGFAEDGDTSIDFSSPNDPAETTTVLEVESRLEVTVVDDVRRPIADAVVQVDPRDRPTILPRLASSTDASGVARFTHLRAGRATIAVSDSRHAAIPPLETALDRAETRRVVVVLDRLASLSVVVHDDRGAASIGVDVDCVVARTSGDGGDVSFTARTDSRGVAHFEALPAGRALVTVGSVHAEPLSMAPGESKKVEVEVPRLK